MKYKKWFYLFSVLIAAIAMTALGVSVFADSQTKAVDTVTVKIHYYYWDDNAPNHQGADRPFNSFVANMPKNSEPMSERCPSIQGYTACDSEGNSLNPAVVTLDFTQNREYEVYYKATDVPYKIRLFKQNLFDMEYTYSGLMNGSGKTGTTPKEFEKDYQIPEFNNKTLDNMFEGFTLMYHQPDFIAADGTTEFECYYDRNHYHVNFDLGDGGYGVEPIYAAYETSINPYSVGTPKRPGYEFTGWKWYDSDNVEHEGLEQQVTHDVTYIAKWEPIQDILYTVVYRNADVSDGSGTVKYSYWGRKTQTTHFGTNVNVRPDDTISLTDIINNLSSTGENDSGEALLDFDYFEFDLQTTLDKNKGNTYHQDGDTFKVRGDGNTVVTLYYRRKSYTIRYAYARQELVLSNAAVSTIDPDSEYLIATFQKHSNNNYEKSFLTSHSTTVDPPGENYGSNDERLILNTESDVSEETPDVKWKFVPVDGQSGQYYVVAAGGDNDGKYLSIGNQTGTMSDTPKAFEITINSDKSFYLKQVDNAMYLNDKKDRGKRANGYNVNNSSSKGNKWYIYSSDYFTEGGKYVPLDGKFQFAKGTGNGNDTGDPISYQNIHGETKDVKKVDWGYRVDTLPEVRNGFHTGVFQKTQSEKVYNYYYIELTAEYGANIESIWPSVPLEKAGSYSFGSWSAEYPSPYRLTYDLDSSGAGHANIVGPYPTMSKELIIDPNNSLAQTMYAWWGDASANIDYHAYEIYCEHIGEGQGEYTVNNAECAGKTFDLERIDIFSCAHNSNTRIDPFSIAGFTVISSEAGGYPKSTDSPHYKKDQVIGTDDSGNNVVQNIWTTAFHYIRKRHSISFYNHSSELYDPGDNIDRSSILYGESLNKYAPRYSGEETVPPYPSSLPANSYEFAGWYTSDLFLENEKVYWEDEYSEEGELLHKANVMPDNDMVLYAYWKPLTFTVTYYNDVDALKNNQQYIETNAHDYGSKIPEEEDQRIKELLNAFEFETAAGTVKAYPAGWYYYDDNGNLHAFDPATMTVSGNMNLFMRWSTTVPTDYAVHYYKAGTTEKVAADNAGHSFVGLTRSFNAKTDTQLMSEYRQNWFPDRRSTSILMYPDNERNVQSFYYTYREKVPYQVRYILVNEDDSQVSLCDPVYHDDNIYAAVTEKYKYFEGYIPKNYYISLILTVDTQSTDPMEQQAHEREMNVITFYYYHDTNNIPYHIKYYQEVDEEEADYVEVQTNPSDTGRVPYSETIDGKTHYFKSVNYIDSIGQKNTTRQALINNYTGYIPAAKKEFYYSGSYNSEIAIGKDSPPESLSPDVSVIEFSLTEGINSKEVYIFYLKKKYPIKVVYSINSDKTEVIARWYDKISFDTKIGHVENDTATAVSIGGNTVYKTVYKIIDGGDSVPFNGSHTETAYDDYMGFRLSGDTVRTIIVTDDTTEDITQNRITFNYVVEQDIMYYYFATRPIANRIMVFEDPGNPKLLSINQENVVTGVRPEQRVNAQYRTGVYQFKGWYRDKNCTDRVQNDPEGGTYTDVLTGEHYEDLLPRPNSFDMYYYAKYDYIRGDLIISTANVLLENSSDYFEFRITGTDEHNSWIDMKVTVPANGSKTIKSLPVGNYSVTQTNWSWRYTPQNKEISTNVTESTPETTPVTVTFKEELKKTKWLDGSGYKNNTFSGSN